MLKNCRLLTSPSRHIDAGTLRVYVHHGQTKARLHSDVETAQVVLTTYETITLGRRSAAGHLAQFSWFRIVLDEAHWIRNRSTQVFQVLNEFEAQKRWCMTGTPVQNGLYDLCALTRWLRFYPFDSSHGFRKFITDPLSKRNGAGLANLRQMTKVFQIRRVKASMNLGCMTLQTITVSLSNRERRQYEAVKATILQTLAESSNRKKSNPSTIVLQGIQELRRICCDGYSVQAPSERSITNIAACGPNMTCNQCGRAINEAARASIFHGQCGHVLCSVCCAGSSTDGLEEDTGELSCPICGSIEEDPTHLDDSSAIRVYDDSVSAAPFSSDQGIEDFVPAKIATVMSKLLELHKGSWETDCKR